MYMYMYAYVSFKRCDFLFSALQFQLVLCQLFLHVTCHVKYSKMHLNKYRCMGRNDNNILLLFVCWSRKVLNVGSTHKATNRVLFHAYTTDSRHVSGTAFQCVWNSLPAHLRDENIAYNSFIVMTHSLIYI